MRKLPISLDRVDRALLAAVQRDNRQASDALAAEVGASRSSVQRRLARLREAGVIEADVSLVAPAALGLPLTFVVEVQVEREQVELLDAFRRSMQGIEQVQQCYYVTGEADFVLIVVASDMADFETLTRRVFVENPNVRRFSTNVVVDRVKVGLALPTGDV